MRDDEVKYMGIEMDGYAGFYDWPKGTFVVKNLENPQDLLFSHFDWVDDCGPPKPTDTCDDARRHWNIPTGAGRTLKVRFRFGKSGEFGTRRTAYNVRKLDEFGYILKMRHVWRCLNEECNCCVAYNHF